MELDRALRRLGLEVGRNVTKAETHYGSVDMCEGKVAGRGGGGGIGRKANRIRSLSAPPACLYTLRPSRDSP